MVVNERTHEISVFQRFLVVEIVHSSRIRKLLPVDGRGVANRHYAARIVMDKVEKLLDQCTAVCSIDITQRFVESTV